MAMAPAVSLDTGSGSQEGRKRAVTIGINYIGTQFQLNGCINDSDTFIGLLTEEFGYHVSDIRQLRSQCPKPGGAMDAPGTGDVSSAYRDLHFVCKLNLPHT